jgi:hypothetical protein
MEINLFDLSNVNFTSIKQFHGEGEFLLLEIP